MDFFSCTFLYPFYLDRAKMDFTVQDLLRLFPFSVWVTYLSRVIIVTDYKLWHIYLVIDIKLSLYLALCTRWIHVHDWTVLGGVERNPHYLVLYFHINHQAFVLFQLQQDVIFQRFILVIREAIFADSNSHTSFQLVSNCCICLDRQFNFHILQNICESFPLLQNIEFSSHFLHSIGDTLHNSLNECLLFSEWVAHSRFSNLLSFLIQFLWLTVLLFSGLGINAVVTSLWIE